MDVPEDAVARARRPLKSPPVPRVATTCQTDKLAATLHDNVITELPQPVAGDRVRNLRRRRVSNTDREPYHGSHTPLPTVEPLPSGRDMRQLSRPLDGARDNALRPL